MPQRNCNLGFAPMGLWTLGYFEADELGLIITSICLLAAALISVIGLVRYFSRRTRNWDQVASTAIVGAATVKDGGISLLPMSVVSAEPDQMRHGIAPVGNPTIHDKLGDIPSLLEAYKVLTGSTYVPINGGNALSTYDIKILTQSRHELRTRNPLEISKIEAAFAQKTPSSADVSTEDTVYHQVAQPEYGSERTLTLDELIAPFLKGSDSPARSVNLSYLGESRYQDLVEACKAARSGKEQSLILCRLAVRYWDRGRYWDANRLYEDAHESDPTNWASELLGKHMDAVRLGFLHGISNAALYFERLAAAIDHLSRNSVERPKSIFGTAGNHRTQQSGRINHYNKNGDIVGYTDQFGVSYDRNDNRLGSTDRFGNHFDKDGNHLGHTDRYGTSFDRDMNQTTYIDIHGNICDARTHDIVGYSRR